MRAIRKNIQSPEGFVVVLVLIALMAMSFYLMTGAATTTSTLKVSGNYAKTVEGFNIAEVGIAKARPILEDNDFDALLTTYAQPDLPLINNTDFNSGNYQVWIEDNDDGDSDFFDDDDDIVIIRSIGTNSSGGTVEILAHLQKPGAGGSEEPFPGAPGGGAGAGMLCGTADNVSTQGAGTITGDDWEPPSLPCTGAGCAGDNLTDDLSACQAIHGATATCDGQYAVVGQSALTVTGTGFESDKTPAVLSPVADTKCDEWKSLKDQLTSLDPSHPSVEVITGTESNDQTFNDCTDPKVFILNTPAATYKLSGNTSLCGILVVASDTSIETAGTVTIIGLVLMMTPGAQLSFVAATGTPQLFGQVIVESQSSVKVNELSAQGSSQIAYSTSGIGFANDAMNNALSDPGGAGGGDGLITMAWQETY